MKLWKLPLQITVNEVQVQRSRYNLAKHGSAAGAEEFASALLESC